MNNIPKGYKLVPVEPTQKMLDAVYGKVGGEFYKAALAAAPTPPQPIYDEADERADSFDRLYTSSLDERDQLQQRADVLESRRGDFELALMWVRSQLTDPKIVQFIDIALKPAEGGGDE